MKDIYILAIETSCDETACSIIKNGREVMSNIISSQIEIHNKFGGVVPEVASRKHVESIPWVVELAIKEAGIKQERIDAIAVTKGPGLVGALLVGLQFAKGFAFSLGVPLIGVNHIEGHVAANFIAHKDLTPPFVSLIVSGGHTTIAHVLDYDKYKILGETRDDAAGEAFDKIARSLGLGYPGGPKIEEKAKKGNPFAIKFPRATFKDSTLDFSFSGLKSSVLNYINNEKQRGNDINVEDISASFQEAIVSVLTDNVMKTAKEKNLKEIALAGGVASNFALRKRLQDKGKEEGVKILFPDPILCTDNAAMIGSRAYYQYIKNDFDSFNVNVDPNLSFAKEV